ncbi:MAG: hypothetical protein RXQ22_05965 [Sulfolobus sp.]
MKKARYKEYTTVAILDFIKPYRTASCNYAITRPKITPLSIAENNGTANKSSAFIMINSHFS